MPSSPIIIWRLIDGTPGHEKQSLGLANALARLTTAVRFDIACPDGLKALTQWLTGSFPQGRPLPSPHLLLGAGHKTHLSLLAAQRAYGGRTVVMMKPSLPCRWFNLCLIPEHDNPHLHAGILPTRGVLNDVQASQQNESDRGLILIGGLSSHYDWDNQKMLEQIRLLSRMKPELHWALTTSRRTPEDFLPSLLADCPSNLTCVSHHQTPPGWLEKTLSRTSQAWVTEDSVSMVYEALTAGCTVGLLRLNRRKTDRVARGIDKLLTEGWLTTIQNAHSSTLLDRPPTPFNEAERCARWILDTWFLNAN